MSPPKRALTVDMIVYAKEDSVVWILLIQLENDPFQEKWALPGGFVELNETLEEAAHRELYEETGIATTSLRQLYAVGTPGRDPRGPSVTVVFTAQVQKHEVHLRAASDAKAVAWFALTDLPALAFDHVEIIFRANTEAIFR